MRRQVLWAVGTLGVLVTIALLVDQLYPGLGEDVSRGRVATLIGIGVALMVLFVLLTMGSASLGWTGFRGKTLWDLLQVLIVPLVLVGIGLVFEMQQTEREERRADVERELADQRSQDEALQAYLDQMGDLLLAKDGLRESKEGSEVRTLARARTLTVLGRLDPKRKTAVMQFLVEAELVQGEAKRIQGLKEPLIGAPLIDLESANLSGIALSWADLSGADLSGANLQDAQLFLADLRHASLQTANLQDAQLFGADLRHANLLWADLSRADLSRAILSGAEDVTKEMLKQQTESLRGATMPDGTILPYRYVSSEFKPALSVRISDGWHIVEAAPGVETPPEAETPDSLSIWGPEGGQLLFSNPPHVFDPSRPIEEFPAPENAKEWVSWFERHPNLDTSKPVPASVGSAPGMRIDVTASSTPENYPQKICDEQPCVPLYLSGVSEVVSYERGYEGGTIRFVIVDVGGETVIMAADARKFDGFTEFVPEAQKILETIEWEGE